MAIAITSSKSIHRWDKPLKPVLTITDASADPANRLIAGSQWYYIFSSGDSPLTWEPWNRTELVSVVARRLVPSTISLSAVLQDGGVTYTNRLSKDPFFGDGWGGGQFADVASGPVGMEMIPGPPQTSTYATTLQSGAGVFSFLDAAVEHALVFGLSGLGQIYEAGVSKLQFEWKTGDKGYIEYRDGIIRYWHIKADMTVKLLRAVRSLMAYPIIPVFSMYHEAAEADVALFLGDEDTVDIQTYGVMNKDFQDWQNSQSLESLAENVTQKDKKPEFTYFTKEKNLISLGINLEWRFEELYQEFREFFQYHDKAHPFIFIDEARKKLYLEDPPQGLNPHEMFAYFISDWKDSPLGVEMYGASVDIKQMVDPPRLPLEW